MKRHGHKEMNKVQEKRYKLEERERRQKGSERLASASWTPAEPEDD